MMTKNKTAAKKTEDQSVVYKVPAAFVLMIVVIYAFWKLGGYYSTVEGFTALYPMFCVQRYVFLALTAAEQAHLGGQAGIQPQIQLLEHLCILNLFFFTNAGTQGSPLATASGDGQILGDLHIRSSAGHGVLEHTADELGALVFRQLGHILAVDHNGAAVHRVHTGDHIQHRGFAGAVAADHCY